MKRILTLFLLLMSLYPLAGKAQFYSTKEPLAHTYSIVAMDPETGNMAVAVQSHWFSVGTAVSWAEAGVGVVATQSFTNKSFGPRGLALLKEGKSPQEALDILLSTDEGREVRQVAILDAQGRVAVHTGEDCIPYAGDIAGENYSVQANMMKTPEVWPAMAAAYEENEALPFPERILKALEAAERQGGDIRGKQSAVLLVVKGEKSAEPWNDEIINLRVDDHPEPIKELARLLKTYRAYEFMNQGDVAVEQGNMAEAKDLYSQAEAMFPENLEMQYWHAITLANNGQVQEAAKMLQKIYKKNEDWRELTRRLPKVGLLNLPKQDLQKLL
ncbi:DUF1028 domain-containing protein [Nafulsella turpanensis]|uniref:DUF1028 domain-containing protein n=1 Tax=Nafulsella turpanensis TaxID=1265690 RepID=UPI00034C25E2|nr:DUF1028 domain-containing protein [Nafulsella turpanensis]